jgi:hypothetical protein
MRYVVRVLVVSASGTTQRTFTVKLERRAQPLIREYLHPPTFSQPRSAARNK